MDFDGRRGYLVASSEGPLPQPSRRRVLRREGRARRHAVSARLKRRCGSQKGAVRGVFQRQGFKLAKLVVYGKVANQAGALRRAGQWRRERCGELAKAAEEVAGLAGEVLKCGGAQCVLGYEGAAASAYWAALSSAFGVPRRRGV